jgi:hypothetical protein
MGRPPLDIRQPSVSVTTSLTAREYDELCKRAIRKHTSVADMLRQRPQRADRADRGDHDER